MRELRAGGPADKRLARTLAASIREAGQEITDGVKSNLAEAPPSGGKRTVGTRRALSGGTKLTVSTSASKGAGVRVTTSSKGLPANRRPMLRLYNKESWRHPVFATYGRRASTKGAKGDLRAALRGLNKALAERDRVKAAWVTQSGRPYFYKALDDRRERVLARVDDAVQDAVRQAAAAISARTT